MASKHPVIATVQPLLKATGGRLIAVHEIQNGDIPLVWEGETVAGVRLPPLHGALDRMQNGLMQLHLMPTTRCGSVKTRFATTKIGL